MSIIIPDEATFTLWIATADAIFRDELNRPPALHLDPAGLASMLQIAAHGGDAAAMVAAVRSSPEWHAIHDAPPVPAVVPFIAAPRVWAGNMCGVRVPGLPAVDGGSSDASLVLSWFYDRYSAVDRAAVRAAWTARRYTHILLSWPDSRAAGQSPPQFLATCRELIADGFYPCVMLSAKGIDPPDVPTIVNALTPVLGLLVGVVPMFCVGWELSLWLSPTQVQQLIDALAPKWLIQPGTLGYAHFQEGYFAYQLPGLTTADFWKANVGKLHGVLHQRNLADLPNDKGNYQARITDCLQRFAGGFNYPADSGFGHPFDFIACEITAEPQFNGQMTEAEGNLWGDVAMSTPPVGAVRVMGSGNGSL